MSEHKGIDARIAPALGAVNFGDLRRLRPIAPNFGFERGTPIDRYYIERFLRERAEDVQGRVLECGDDTYTRTFGGERVLRSDVLHVTAGHPGATIIADLSTAPELPSDSFDCVICTQTLQFIYDFHMAIVTLHRILAPGGVLLATFPGISQTDDRTWQDSWYWGFTAASARRLFGGMFGSGHVQVQAHGNVFAAVCFLHGIAVEEVHAAELDLTDLAFPLLITVRADKPLRG